METLECFLPPHCKIFLLLSFCKLIPTSLHPAAPLPATQPSECSTAVLCPGARPRGGGGGAASECPHAAAPHPWAAGGSHDRHSLWDGPGQRDWGRCQHHGLCAGGRFVTKPPSLTKKTLKGCVVKAGLSFRVGCGLLFYYIKVLVSDSLSLKYSSSFMNCSSWSIQCIG